MICKVKPYNGDKPYIFFSYCRADAESVYSIIETMASKGYRIWFNEGVRTDVDSLEILSQKIKNSFICVTVVSQTATQSHGWRNELTYAIEYGKKIISIKLENMPFTLGIRLQLALTQVIEKYECSTQDFYNNLYAKEEIKECLGSPHEIEYNQATESISEIIKQEHKLEEQLIAKENDEHIKRVQKIKIQRIVAEEAERIKQEQESEKHCDIDDENEQLISEQAHNETILLNSDSNETVLYSEDDPENTVLEEDNVSLAIVRLNTSELFLCNYPMISLGRSKNKCDIYFESVKTISSHHADIIIHADHCFLVDHHSANSTYINGRKMDKDEKCEIVNYAEIGLSRSETLFVALNKYAEWLIKNMCLISLQSVGTKEKMYFFDDETIIGRSYPWSSGAMSDGMIGRQHAVIKLSDGKCFIMDKSKNGTEVNNSGKIEQMKWIELHNGDNIKIGNERFVLNIYSLKKGAVV